MENDMTAAYNKFLAEPVKTWQYQRD